MKKQAKDQFDETKAGEGEAGAVPKVGGSYLDTRAAVDFLHVDSSSLTFLFG